jgi:lysozyme
LLPVLPFAKTTNAFFAASVASLAASAPTLVAAQPAAAALGPLSLGSAGGHAGRVLTTIPVPPPVSPSNAPAPEAVPTAARPLPQPHSVALSVPLPPPGPRVYAITPERRALLNTIRYAEGTWAGGADVGYRIMFGGGLMPSLDRHPNTVVRTARYASAAAGAYQFMPPTWAMVSRALGFRLQGPEAFGPQVQDQAALFLVQRRGVLHLADQGQFTPYLAHRLAPEWASFPTLAGHSFYGQPVKRYHELRQFYEQNLAYLRQRQQRVLDDLAAAEPPEPDKPACLPADSLRCQLEALDTLGPRSAS